jgi:hypothetical protein
MLLAGSAAALAQTEAANGRRMVPMEEVAPSDVDWMSYRDAYRQMIRFEKYGKPKNLIQSHFQVVPRERGIALYGVQLTLAGTATQLNLPLDAVGRAVFPFVKSAYDDNARLALNRAAGLFRMQERISITPRADGVYEAAELRAACEQALDYLRYIGKPNMQDRRCVGVRFSFPRNAPEPPGRVRSADRAPAALTIEDAAPFPDEPAPLFKTTTLLFANWPEKSQVVIQNAPVAIAPLFR